MVLGSVISINTYMKARILKISKFWLLRLYLERNNVIFLANLKISFQPPILEFQAVYS